MIGSCDCCDRQKVPVNNLVAYGIDTTACFICRGGDEVDPYGELDEPLMQSYEKCSHGIHAKSCSTCAAD